MGDLAKEFLQYGALGLVCLCAIGDVYWLQRKLARLLEEHNATTLRHAQALTELAEAVKMVRDQHDKNRG